MTEEDKMKSDQLAFHRRVKRIHRGPVANQVREAVRLLHQEFEQALLDHKTLRGQDASTGYGDNSFVADHLVDFFVCAAIGGYEP